MTAKIILQCRPSSHPFTEREIPLAAPIKIGRAVANCKPGNDNGYFNCKVLSRNHALLWYENGKFYIQDTQSSNGTFVNNQKLPTGAPPASPNTQGTLRSDPANDGRKEVSSGDVVQFGVEVVEQAKKGAPPVTHGCIVAHLKLFHADGTEARGNQKIQIHQNAQSDVVKKDEQLGNGEPPKLTMHELYELQAVLQEAHHREQVLESKLAALNKILTAMDRKDSWTATFQEDLLLSKIQFLQGQLHAYEARMKERPNCLHSRHIDADAQAGIICLDDDKTAKPPIDADSTDMESATEDSQQQAAFDKLRDSNLISDDYKIAVMAEWKNMLDERAKFESVAKETLQASLAEKLETAKTLAVTEEKLLITQTECDNLSTICQNSQKDLLQLVDKFQQQSHELESLTRTYQESERVKIECLDVLKGEKSALEEQLASIQQQYDDRKYICGELVRQNAKLLRKIRRLKGRTFAPNDSDHPAGDVLSNGYPPEDEASDDDEDDVALEMGPSPDLREQFLPENIFQGKDVAHLMEQIGNMEKEQGNNEENDNTSSESRRRIHRPAFGDVDLLRNLAPSTQSSYNAALANGAEKVHSSQDTHGQTGDPNDMELEQLLRDNDSLTDLVMKLQAELAARDRADSERAAKMEPVTVDHTTWTDLHSEDPSVFATINDVISAEKIHRKLDEQLEELERMIPLEESSSKTFQSPSFLAFWKCHDPEVIVALLFFLIWLIFIAIPT